MNDLRRVSGLAIVLLVVLRLAIGWQFLYEGLWKLSTLDGPEPWTSEGYLKSAQGPLRNYFRGLTGDPDDLEWLDYENISRKWYDFRDRFAKHYGLSDDQRKTLDRLLDGSAERDTAPDEAPPVTPVTRPLASLPPEINADRLGRGVRYDEQRHQLVVTPPLLPRDEAELLELVDVQAQPDGKYVRRSDPAQPAAEADVAFYEAVERAARDSRKLPFRHQLAGLLRGNPETTGVKAELNASGKYDVVMGTVKADEAGGEHHNIRYGKIQEYRDLLKEHERLLSGAKMDYQQEHATRLGRKLASLRTELTGPVRALDSSLKEAARKLLTPEQLRLGRLPPEETPLARADRQVLWGLLVLGSLLLVGFLTRGAALLGAVMLFMFYLVIPPWPGVPPAPGPEHSFIVNKNLIECLALLAIAALPTGSWFGLDGLFSRLWRRWRVRRSPAATS